MNNKIIIAILTLIIILLVGIIAYANLIKPAIDNKFQEYASQTYSQALIDVAQSQTQTGDILIWNNNVTIMNINEICGSNYLNN